MLIACTVRAMPATQWEGEAPAERLSRLGGSLALPGKSSRREEMNRE